jgi:uncharacterized membrane protein
MPLGRGYAATRFGERTVIGAAFFVLAVDTGIVVIVVAIAVVLVVLFVTASMRGLAKRSAEERVAARRDVDRAEARGADRQRDRDASSE